MASAQARSSSNTGITRHLLDASAGPMHPVATQTLSAALEVATADPAARHAEGRRARGLLETARSTIARGLGVAPETLSFAPSGAEALRHVVDGVLYAARRRGARTVASAVEHSAVLAPASARAAQADDPTLLAKVGVDSQGRVDLSAFAKALVEPGTVVACLQSANGEVGTRQPISEAWTLCQEGGIPLVVDAMASLGRDEVPDAWDVLVGDARSWGGPALGVIVVRPGTRIDWPGSVQDVEAGRWPTAPWVPLALSAAEAWQQTAADATQEAAQARALIDQVRAAAGAVADTEVAGDPVDRLPHVVTFSSLYADGESLVEALDRDGLAVASGSACTSSTLEPSHVLAAMGRLTHGNVRVTLPLRAIDPDRATAVDRLCDRIGPTVENVRSHLGVGEL